MRDHTGRPNTDRFVHARNGSRRHFTRAICTGRENAVQFSAIIHQLVVALAHGCQVVRHRITDCDLEVAVAAVAELTLEIMGHQGLGWAGEDFTPAELDAVRGWLGGKASTIYGGSQEVQNNIISKRILGLPDPAATQ